MEQNNLLCPLRPINPMGIMDKLQWRGDGYG